MSGMMVKVSSTYHIMPDIASAEIFLDTLNHRQPSAKFTMEVERNASLPFIGVDDAIDSKFHSQKAKNIRG